ncbi:hypothetical protein [Helicobacter sp. MIT 14-3879]|uniref:hypothetical protein n=1 Tax=Helicobacter sp. MIT 14-3879 TaxID=2040649 RepID=UPI000E1E53F2|nr:hypothetical protein [Helicobacter sp. MIT 14-3879]RDU64154.1 hypothetical protein CQA44_04310 [Helicobacter sp. MIT 14-3879]
MAISQIGNITHINQNVTLNSQIQANNLNHPNIQSVINMQDFNDKVKENIEVRPTQGVEVINKDSSNKKQDKDDKEDSALNKEKVKKSHINNYGGDSVLLDIEV